GTVAARFGYAWDRTMLYAKGGWAGVRVSARAVNITNGGFADFTDWSNGWTVGVGWEHVPWLNNLLRVEDSVYGGITFDHAGLDKADMPFRFYNSDATIWAITVRPSYLFGPPIVTRYVN